MRARQARRNHELPAHRRVRAEAIVMSLNYIDRSHDEEIIDIVRSVLDNGSGRWETFNEHILIKLMQMRGTPITTFEFDQERVDSLFDIWKADKES